MIGHFHLNYKALNLLYLVSKTKKGDLLAAHKSDLKSPMPAHELFHAVQGFFDLAVFGGIA